MIGTSESMLVFAIWIIVWILPVIVFWKICSKAGFSGALSLLMLVPLANIVLPLFVAFAEWPALKNSKDMNT